MKAWLKGGLIGLWIGVAVALVYLIVLITDFNNTLLSYTLNILFVPCYLLNFPSEAFGVCGVFAPIMSLIYGFVIGALIGFIIGKFKNRNKQNQRVKQK